MSRLNILYLSSEVSPFVKVGGLADVANSFPRALKELNHDIRVFLPKYKLIRDRKYNLREVIRLRDINVPFGDETLIASVKSGFIPESKVQTYFLEYKPFYNRPDIYIDPKTGEGWADNFKRFAFFSKAAFETLKVLYWQPDIIHCNDWQSALVPLYLKTHYSDDEFFKDVKVVLSIHNVGYQGVFDAAVVPEIDANGLEFNEQHPAWFHGQCNFLKSGIETADLLTTVSPTYAEEITQSDKLGAGLREVLKANKSRLVGILNGINTLEWNPETDKLIESNYSLEDLSGKKENRDHLLKELGINCPDDHLLIGMISRLVEQKGFDLLLDAIDRLMEMPVELVILGKGQPEIESGLQKIADKYPGRISLNLLFDNQLAHKIEAGTDAFLMPSRYEPCGLNQMFSQVYGTVPIVRNVGGLADSVTDVDEGSKRATGFYIHEHSPESLVEAVKLSHEWYSAKDRWLQLVKNGMSQNFSWNVSVEKYIDLYNSVQVTAAV